MVMRSFFSNFSIKIYKILIPYLVRFRAFYLLSLLFRLSLTELKSKFSKRKAKFKIVILSKSGGVDDVLESQKIHKEHKQDSRHLQ